jgi:hypothetical protein
MRWVHCVAPNMRCDSPRLAYYISCWNIPSKIAREKANGTWNDLIKNCPILDPAHIPNALAALAESNRYNGVSQKIDRSKPGIVAVAAKHDICSALPRSER